MPADPPDQPGLFETTRLVIPSDLTPHTSARRVALTVLMHAGPYGRIETLQLVRDGLDLCETDIRCINPIFGQLWYIQARGAFQTFSGPPRQRRLVTCPRITLVLRDDKLEPVAVLYPEQPCVP